MVQIKESNMIFGDFQEDKIFKIEKSKLHNKIGDGIKVVEFILLRNVNELNFIEAKSSSPRPTQHNIIRFDEFIDEISDKFIHSFNLFYSAILKRNKAYGELNNNFFELNNSQAKLKFILVIKGHEIEWLLPISDALKRKLSYHNTIWKSEIIVMNDKIANKYNLVKSVVE
ncbi:hypothetical protein CPAST_c28450 [Clostridium pasteurianum DSM 525 = ATCC 6013]|uniref:Uncharacterized protein n=1 Tax=Clostridium pasteurianum DSM 525 = ATCC 6013 TaxID=1262449 RepID=A0A0H3J4S3_CLOPA|nr:hypothetical protein [Clostridium pasteurianum]AJA48911.1 hypothetical protein CPAST_c28450 [Clostridium pasteurianum DSM 525 = ATCC 6013]AJA52899.1 hypothetical protein CLPA_c28450 [Clostridium pasteurianum DSM 525 = ATCC 6013]AOZ76120.1 hypothetical protein AQ983_13820 [Clostridium pasteurianum DSM 525 = ATCC 6013]AOZ79916.1 hypothetical protein AQ984_13815 [Clostridium pasteurianum]ELP60207.1 hypothetical protein F502_06207 [Clostridium pasteurianum DSM 525 = ATCC 6013]